VASWSSVRDWFRGMLGYKQDPLPEEHAIDEFFKFGSQYYVAGRYGMFAGFMPVAANLHHHAIEMLLKGALSKSMNLEELKRKLGHRLPKIWKKFKRQANDPSLNRFEKPALAFMLAAPTQGRMAGARGGSPLSYLKLANASQPHRAVIYFIAFHDLITQS
jgi:hypothetical protein